MSRIDRIYVDGALQPAVAAASVARCRGGSDHSPVLVDLVAASTLAAVGAGRRGARLYFEREGHLQAAFEQWLEAQEAAAPADSAALLAWWPQFKLAAFQQIRALNWQWRAGREVGGRGGRPRGGGRRLDAAQTTMYAALHAAATAPPGAPRQHRARPRRRRRTPY